MKVAVLCPGPSLKKTWNPKNPYQVILAVNRAALVQQPHWWVAGDWMYLKDTAAKPITGYCTIRDVVRILEDGTLLPKERMPAKFECVAWEDLPFQRSFSVVAALGLACHLGARDVHVYGDDKNGANDFDGWVGYNRGHSRWEEETAAMNAGIDFLNTRNIIVTRIKG
jgi:hypothetical protein